MAKYWKKGLDYEMRLADKTIINVNSPQACELILGLYEYIAKLEAQAKKRTARRSRKQQQPKVGLENE